MRPASASRRRGVDPLEQTPVDAGHREHAGGAAPVEHAVRAMPRANHSRARAASKATSRSSASRCSAPRPAAPHAAAQRGAPGLLGQPEAAQILGRQVDPRPRSASSRTSRRMFVSCSATPRSSASCVGAPALAQPRAVAHAEDRQAHAADRAGDPAAVRDELLEGLVAGPSTSIRTPSTSSPSASSGSGKRLRASASATITGSPRESARRCASAASAASCACELRELAPRPGARRRRCRRHGARTRRPRTSRGGARARAA